MWCTRFCSVFLPGIVLLAGLFSCNQSGTDPLPAQDRIIAPQRASVKLLNDTSELERYFISKQLVNVQQLEPNIRVALAYATDQNFLHKIIYKDLKRCYLPCQVAIKLCNAEYFLNQANPLYHLIVFDAVRPLHIQQQMWDELDMPAWKKINYLADPSQISLHNYGAAVDVGIVCGDTLLLDMGTSFDSFNELSQPKNEARFLKDGTLTEQAYNNRLILRRAMLRAGFSMMYTEWWHFNATNKTTAAARYGLIE
jgi:D-alanyl-D-alanine dipeptidase